MQFPDATHARAPCPIVRRTPFSLRRLVVDLRPLADRYDPWGDCPRRSEIRRFCFDRCGIDGYYLFGPQLASAGDAVRRLTLDVGAASMCIKSPFGQEQIVEESRIGLILLLLREGSTQHAVKVYQEEAEVSYAVALRSVRDLARQHGIDLPRSSLLPLALIALAGLLGLALSH